MSVWPDYAKIEADSYRVAYGTHVLRTGFDDGFVRQERLAGQPLVLRHLHAMLDGDQAMNDFRTWAETYAHSWFAFIDPEDGIARQVRVRGGLGGMDFHLTSRGRVRRWSVKLALEGYADHLVSAVTDTAP